MLGTSTRVLALLSLLQVRRDWSGQDLADRLGVTVRTVRRDVDRLRELGYTVTAVMGPDGGYRLAAGTDLPPMLFDDEQAVALAVALGSVPSTGVDVEEAAARALATVRQVLPSRLRHRVDGIRFADAGTPVRVDPATLAAVSAATREQRVLRFGYGDAEDPRRTEPHAVVARGGRWYLVAWDLDRDDWRTFRLDRLVPRTPTGARFAPRPVPTGDARTFVAARAKGATEDAWPCVGEVVLHRPAAEVVPWLGDGELIAVDEGTCRVRIGSWSWTGVLAWVLRFDAPFTVVGPPALAEAGAALAVRLAAATTGGR
ncbi:helix-turn-helix transcriptional regulator [Cellulomonas triticagri]|uniref:Transcriptional regulator n=1 Tax=Cellulomonas triticagri TaxID=2483352 RepID=A0A3M2JH35_9CELL|nr:transcriptional regulator [Cellulomonas triticagri]RMI09588.1 transcriptional regulator [Cellulomonas triticagri]